MRRLVLVLLIVSGCGSPALKKVGETCTASSECESGLLCDLAQSPAVCANKGSLDAAPMGIDAGRTDGRAADARVIDAPADASIDAPDAM